MSKLIYTYNYTWLGTKYSIEIMKILRYSLHVYPINRYQKQHQVTLMVRSSLTLFLFLSLSLSFAIHLYYPSLPVISLGCIKCSHKVDVSLWVSFNTKVFIKERCLWVHSYFSSNVMYVLLGWFARWEVVGRTVTVFVGGYFKDLFKTGRSILV